MKGQWTGFYNSSTRGLITVDVDELSDSFEGNATLTVPNAPEVPQLYIMFRTDGKASDLNMTCSVNPLYRARILTPDEAQRVFPTAEFPRTADIKVKWTDQSLDLAWSTDLGTTGSAVLPRNTADRPSVLNSIKMTWEGFKQHAFDLQEHRYIFRGQERPWRLRTGFHRKGRANLERFLAQDVQTLHKHLSGKTRHFFDLSDADQNGAFLNLIQHHGYPTPLLDWTFSPFVAAYFAFSNVNRERAEKASDDDVVRIHVLDKNDCVRDFPPVPTLTKVGPHFSLMEFNSVENERLIPQQAISSLSTIDDIENYLMFGGRLSSSSSFYAIDIYARHRLEALRDLRRFGITTASLFPGLDGACKELRDRFFDF